MAPATEADVLQRELARLDDKAAQIISTLNTTVAEDRRAHLTAHWNGVALARDNIRAQIANLKGDGA